MGLRPYTPSPTPVWPAANILMYTGVGAGAPSRGVRRPLVVTNNFTMGLTPLCPTTTNEKAQAPARASLVTVPSRGCRFLRVVHQGQPAGQGMQPIVVPTIVSQGR